MNIEEAAKKAIEWIENCSDEEFMKEFGNAGWVDHTDDENYDKYEYVHSKIVELQNEMKYVRQDIEEYIQNKDIHLDNRWNLYKEMPNEIKKYSDSVLHFDSLNMINEILDYGYGYTELWRYYDLVAIYNMIEKDEHIDLVATELLNKLKEEFLQSEYQGYFNS